MGKSLNNQNFSDPSRGIPTECPHCGKKLSPWQQVLLSVDRVLTCKNCWYRIILSVQPEAQTDIDSETPEKE